MYIRNRTAIIFALISGLGLSMPGPAVMADCSAGSDSSPAFCGDCSRATGIWIQEFTFLDVVNDEVCITANDGQVTLEVRAVDYDECFDACRTDTATDPLVFTVEVSRDGTLVDTIVSNSGFALRSFDIDIPEGGFYDVKVIVDDKCRHANDPPAARCGSFTVLDVSCCGQQPDPCAAAAPEDCNGNSVADDCEIACGAVTDCNDNGHLDECDIADGTSSDLNGNGLPDECEMIHGRARSACESAELAICDVVYALDAFDGLEYEADTCANPENVQSMWFKYVPTEPGLLEVYVCSPQANMDFAVSIHSDCAGTELDCSEIDQACDSNWGPTVSTSVSSDQSYLIRLAAAPTERGDATVMIVGPPGMDYDCDGNGEHDTLDLCDCAKLGVRWEACAPNTGSTRCNCNCNDTLDICEVAASVGCPSGKCTGNDCLPDCNQNCIPDACDIDPVDPDFDGIVWDDLDGNGVPDVCDPDCDGDGTADGVEIVIEGAPDCNFNGVPDECDIGTGVACDLLPPDPNGGPPGDGIPDECECPSLHVVFIVDTSGSMGDEGVAICDALSQLQLVFSSNANIEIDQLGITSFCDINCNIDCLEENVLDSLGNQIPNDPACCSELAHYEDWGTATAIVAKRFNWKLGALRLIVPISDAAPRNGHPCNDPGDDRDTITNTIAVANDNGVIVSPLGGTCNGCSQGMIDCQSNLAIELAQATGGIYLETQTGNGPIDAIRQVLKEACGSFPDCNQNGLSDPCEEPDCNGNYVPDDCDVDPADPDGDDDVFPDTNGNGIPDICDGPPPEAIITVVLDANDMPPPIIAGAYEVDECEVLKLDGSGSLANTDPEGLTFMWDLDATSGHVDADAISPDVFFVRTSDADTTLYTVSLRVQNENGRTDEATVDIRVRDLAPSVSVMGETSLLPGQEGLYVASVYSPCDALEPVEWEFAPDEIVPTIRSGSPPEVLTQKFTWQAAGQVTVRVTDIESDPTNMGDSAEDMLTITFPQTNPPYLPQSMDLAVETRYHTYEEEEVGNPPAIHIKHRTEMRVVNVGTRDVPAPIYLAFQNLLPTGTTLTGELNISPNHGPLELDVPHLAILETGDLLPSDATSWKEIEWEVVPPGPNDPSEDFSFEAIPYATQRPPQITSEKITEATEGELYSYQVEAIDPEGNAIYYELFAPMSPPGDMFLNAATGLLTWTPSQTAADEGPYNVTIRAHDGFVNSFGEQSFEITVTAVNLPPVIDSTPVITALEGQAYEYVIEAHDPDGDVLMLSNYHLEIKPESLLPEDEMVIEEGPAPDFDIKIRWPNPTLGLHLVDLRVSDAEFETPQFYLLEVIACDPQDRPVIDRDADNETAVEGEPYTKQIALVAPADPVHFFLDVAPEDMTIDPPTGIIQWLPSYNDHGLRTVRVLAMNMSETVSDCHDTYAFQIDVEDRNAAPEILTTALPSATEGNFYVFQIEADDPDGDAVEFDLVNPQPDMFIRRRTGVLTWQPSQTAAVNQPHAVGVQVRDPSGAFVEDTFDLSVTAVNVPPVITSSPRTYAQENEPYDYEIKVSDPDDPAGTEPLQFHLVQRAADDMSVPGGVVTWTPGLGSSEDSPYFVEVSVSDGVHTVPHSYNLNVYPPPQGPNHPPKITIPPNPPSFAIVDQDYIYQVDATDVDVDNGEDTLHYRLEGAPPFMKINANTGAIPEIPNTQPSAADLSDGEPKLYNVRIIVEDERNGWAVLAYPLIVYPAPVDQPPLIISDPNTAAQVGIEYQYVVRALDVDSTSLQFNVVPAPENGQEGDPLVAPPVGMISDNSYGDDHTALIRWTPTINDVGTRWIKVTVTDESNTSDQLYPLTIRGTGDNHPPQITSPSNRSARVDVPYEYAVMITDEDAFDSHEYELLIKPAGAEINPFTGVINWTPIAAQFGLERFEVQVTDLAGASDRQAYDVAVSSADELCQNNVPPVITSVPLPWAQVDSTYVYNIEFTDDNDGAQNCDGGHTFSFERKPAGMSFDLVHNFKVLWTPTANDIGTHHVSVRVTDAQGAWHQQDFDVSVSNVFANQTPQIISIPQTRAQVGVKYVYQVFGIDEDGDPIQFRMQRKPSAADLLYPTDSSATIQWTPTQAQVGPNNFSVRVIDGPGAWSEQNFTVTVSLDGENRPPVITSDPILRAARGANYAYQVCADDPDSGETLRYSLDESPLGMTVGQDDGLIEWQASLVDGTYPVTVRVKDGHEAWDAQSYFITVSETGENRPPRITTMPVTISGVAYEYQVEAVDDDGDVLTWVSPLPVHPGTMTISHNGLIEWNAEGISDWGTHDVTVHVMDSHGAIAEQSFTVTISGTNRPPEIITTPPPSVLNGDTYVYKLEAFDPDDLNGANLTWRSDLPLLGSMLTSNGNHATLSWDTSIVPFMPGTYSFSVEVEDINGGWDVQTFQVTLGANLPPEIVSMPNREAIVGVEYVYDVEAIDPENDTLTYDFAFDTHPPGMTIDPDTGRITWTPDVSHEGQNYEVLVSVDDGPGNGSGSQQYTLHVQSQEDANTFFPEVSVTAEPESVDLASSPPHAVTIQINATDEIAIQGNQVHLVIKGPDPTDGTIVALVDEMKTLTDGVALHTFTPSDPGPYEVIASATDVGGQTSEATTDFRAFDSSLQDTNPPAIAITDPTNVNTNPNTPPTTPEVKGMVEILGWAVDENFYKYELAYHPVGETGDFIVFDAGYEPVGGVNTPATLGTFDTTMLPNGIYDIRLKAFDLAGSDSVDIVTVAVVGNQKVGNFTMSFTDLAIPIGGIPITVTRTYDSRDKFQRDFGYGWKLELSSLQLQESFPLEQGWETFAAGFGFCGIGQSISHTISITWPDGRVETFAAVPNYAQNSGDSLGGCLGVKLNPFGNGNAVDFVRVTPGTSTLRLDGPPPGWVVGGFMASTIEQGGDPGYWQATGYVLTAGDGTVYTFDKRNHLTGVSQIGNITDRNGNTITFSENSIEHSAGPTKVFFQRDDDGRILKVIDPAGNAITYDYDSAGDLIQVTDRTENTTEFVYNDNHDLLDIIDPRGISVARNIYDDDGRLIATIDAAGNRIEYNHDLDGRREIVRDRLGNETVFIYDEDGNVTQQSRSVMLDGNPTTITTHFEYDANNNQTKTILPDDSPDLTDNPYIEQIFDLATNNLLSERDRFNNVTTYTYTPENEIETITDPKGNVTRFEYDVFGNQTRTIRERPNSENIITELVYDGMGNVTSRTNALGHVTQLSYDLFGRLTQETSPNGAVTKFFYDTNGNQTKSIRTRTLPDGTTEEVVSEVIYDESGLPIRQINPLGIVKETEYNSAGRPVAIHTADGDTLNDYDAVGQLVRTTYPDGSTQKQKYDVGGRKIQSTDRDGRVTNYVHDAFGRVVKTYLPDKTPEIDFDGPYQATIYNELGEVVERRTHEDPIVFHYTRFERTDNLRIVRNYVTEVEGSPQSELVTETEYDNNGNVIRITDARGKTTIFKYDDRNRRIRTYFHDENMSDLSDNPYIETTYDKLGRKIAERDPAGVVTQFKYDSVGRLTKVIDATGGETTYTYDELGNRLTQTDAEGRTTTMEYNALGQLTKRILPDGQLEEMFSTPDAAGRLTTHTDFNGDTISFEYDNLGRFVKKTLPPAPTLTNVVFAYTPGGLRTQAGGATVCSNPGEPGTQCDGDTYAYNDEGRLKREIKANGDMLEYLYDFKGNRTKLTVTTSTDPQVVKVTDYKYDELDRLIKVTDYDDQGNSLETIYTYDKVGNRKTLTNPTGVVTEHAYDDLNRLTRITSKRADDAVLSDYQYFLGPAGNRTRVNEINENGEHRDVTWKYDELYRLTCETITYPNDSTKNRKTAYKYDKVGNREEMIIQVNGCTTVVDYEYNDLDQLIRETRSITPLASANFDDGMQYAMSFGDGTQIVATVPDHRPPPSPYAKPALIALASVTLLTVFAPLFLLWPRAPGLRSRQRRRRFFTVSVALCMTPCMVISPKEVQALHHEAALYQMASALPATSDLSSVTIIYQYDKNGNMTRRERADNDADVYVYDVENRLTEVCHYDGTLTVPQVQYTYDADGIRNSKTELPSGVVTKYLTDKNRPYSQVLVETSIPQTGDPSVTTYLYGDDLLSQTRYAPGDIPGEPTTPGTRSYYLYDGQLSVRQLTDVPADPSTTLPVVTDSYAYDAFGVLLDSTGNTVNQYRYTGEQYDPNSGFYYLRARYMNPSAGRFINHDPFEGHRSDPMSLHKYLYANGNPVMNRDPSGLISIKLAILLAVVVVLLFLYAFARRDLSPATNTHGNNILRLRIQPLIAITTNSPNILPGTHPAQQDFNDRIQAASDFWRRWAGIEFVWDRNIPVVRGDGVFCPENVDAVEGIVNPQYQQYGVPVAMLVSKIGDEPDTDGFTSGNGFVVTSFHTGETFAHEMGHVLIPRMFTHSIWATHIQGNPANLMASGQDREDANQNDLAVMFMTQRQVDEARSTVTEEGWN